MSQDLERSRERFERSLDELRGAIQDEIGWWPKAKKWALPIAATAVGVVFGLAVRRALPGRSQRRLR
jgi:hypothetical protein